MSDEQRLIQTTAANLAWETLTDEQYETLADPACDLNENAEVFFKAGYIQALKDGA